MVDRVVKLKSGNESLSTGRGEQGLVLLRLIGGVRDMAACS